MKQLALYLLLCSLSSQSLLMSADTQSATQPEKLPSTKTAPFYYYDIQNIASSDAPIPGYYWQGVEPETLTARAVNDGIRWGVCYLAGQYLLACACQAPLPSYVPLQSIF